MSQSTKERILKAEEQFLSAPHYWKGNEKTDFKLLFYLLAEALKGEEREDMERIPMFFSSKNWDIWHREGGVRIEPKPSPRPEPTPASLDSKFFSWDLYDFVPSQAGFYAKAKSTLTPKKE